MVDRLYGWSLKLQIVGRNSLWGIQPELSLTKSECVEKEFVNVRLMLAPTACHSSFFDCCGGMLAT